MKYILNLLVLFTILALSNVKAQTIPGLPRAAGMPENWTQAQLIQPAALVSILKNPKAKKPVIFNIGVVDDIPGAINVGAASEQANRAALKKALASLPKNTMVVVYCGCCPFEKCPNVRPAFQLVKESGFTNGRLLNLPTNLKTDWISKGYPMAVKK